MKEKIFKFLHDLLGWGFPKKLIGEDAFQPTYSCKYCEKTLAQDSTGAWFHLEDYGEFADKLLKTKD